MKRKEMSYREDGWKRDSGNVAPNSDDVASTHGTCEPRGRGGEKPGRRKRPQTVRGGRVLERGPEDPGSGGLAAGGKAPSTEPQPAGGGTSDAQASAARTRTFHCDRMVSGTGSVSDTFLGIYSLASL